MNQNFFLTTFNHTNNSQHSTKLIDRSHGSSYDVSLVEITDMDQIPALLLLFFFILVVVGLTWFISIPVVWFCCFFILLSSYLRTRDFIRGFVRPLVRLLVRLSAQVKEWENECFWSFPCMHGCGKGVRWGVDVVGRSCPPVGNDLVTPRHLFGCFVFWRCGCCCFQFCCWSSYWLAFDPFIRRKESYGNHHLKEYQIIAPLPSQM